MARPPKWARLFQVGARLRRRRKHRSKLSSYSKRYPKQRYGTKEKRTPQQLRRYLKQLAYSKKHYYKRYKEHAEYRKKLKERNTKYDSPRP